MTSIFKHSESSTSRASVKQSYQMIPTKIPELVVVATKMEGHFELDAFPARSLNEFQQSTEEQILD